MARSLPNRIQIKERGDELMKYMGSKNRLAKELIPIIIVLYISFVLFAWYFLRVKVKVYIDEFVYYPMFGRKRTYKWNEVGMTELVHIKSGYSIKLYDRNDKKICEIPPFYKNQKNFVETVQVHTGRPWMK